MTQYAYTHYVKIHRRIFEARGRASDYECFTQWCTERANEWSLAVDRDHLMELSVSEDPFDYRPLCWSHHRLLDCWARRELMRRSAHEIIDDLAGTAKGVDSETIDDLREILDLAFRSRAHVSRPFGESGRIWPPSKLKPIYRTQDVAEG